MMRKTSQRPSQMQTQTRVEVVSGIGVVWSQSCCVC